VANNPIFRNIDLEKTPIYLEIKEECCKLLTVKLPKRTNEQIENGCTRFLNKVITGLRDAKNHPPLQRLGEQWDEEKKQLEQPKPETLKIGDTVTPRTETTHEWVLPPSNLKVSSKLIGREEKVDEACEQLLREDVRLLTLTGAGGIGKTSLCENVATSLRSGFADHVYFVDLATIEKGHSAGVVPKIAEALEIREEDVKG